MKRYLTPDELSPDSHPLIRATRAYLRARLRESDPTASPVLAALLSELDQVWRRTAVEEAWSNFWRKFRLHSLTPPDVYDIKLFLAESFPERPTTMRVNTGDQHVVVGVDMGGYTLEATVPVVPRQERAAKRTKLVVQASAPATSTTSESVIPQST